MQDPLFGIFGTLLFGLTAVLNSFSPVVVPQNYIYENPVNGPQECTKYERYDPNKKVCFYQCTSDQQCTQIENSINSKISSWTNGSQNNFSFQENVTSITYNNLLSDYDVLKGERLSFYDGTDYPDSRKIWQEISALSPNNLSDNYIDQFVLYDDLNDDSAAFVDDQNGDGKWRIAINYAQYKDEDTRERKLSFIHELGHIISLNETQMVINQTSGCKNLQEDEGCMKPKSYLNLFYNQFWASDPKQKYSENNFVDEYAATNEGEDWAETFAYFVLGNEIPLDGTIESAKINFYYNFPELVEIRSDMRNAIAIDLIKSGNY